MLACLAAPSMAAFLDEVCLPLLLDSQLPEGAWPFVRGRQAAVEPTCWALVALYTLSREDLSSTIGRGLEALGGAQLPDGSWPAWMSPNPGIQGCWTTALACLALNRLGALPDAVSRGLEWLVNTWPAEGEAWRLFLRRLFGRRSVVRQDASLRGWSWTQGTASWVEPTACALLALRSARAGSLPKAAAKRRSLAERMLYDRMCPGGGWNSGNPLVYGVAGQPRVGPTVWALLALAQYADRRENQASLAWLEREYTRIEGAVSLALAHVCLSVYGKKPPAAEAAFSRLYARNQFLGSVLAAAWTAIASREWGAGSGKTFRLLPTPDSPLPGFDR